MEKSQTSDLKELLRQANHAVFSPLSAVLNTSELLLFEALSDTARHYVEAMLHDTERLMASITVVMALVEYVTLPLQRTSVEVADLLAKGIAQFREAIAPTDVEIVVDIAPEVLPMDGDAKALQQVIAFLLKNAVAFTDEKIVYVGAILDQGQVQIKISENIAAQDHKSDRVFLPTSRIRDSWGLELLLCEQILRLHDSTLSLFSLENERFGLNISFPSCSI